MRDGRCAALEGFRPALLPEPIAEPIAEPCELRAVPRPEPALLPTLPRLLIEARLGARDPRTVPLPPRWDLLARMRSRS